MNKLTKKQLMIGALILLFAINLAALGTIIYQNYQANQQPAYGPGTATEEMSDPGFDRENRPGNMAPDREATQPGERRAGSNRRRPGRMSGERSFRNREPKDAPDMRGRFHRYVREKLELDDGQYRQYQDLMASTRNKQREIALKLESKRDSMMQELTLDNPDEKKLEQLANEIGHLHTRLKQNTIAHFNQLRSICRPEQRKALNEMMMEMSHHGRPGSPATPQHHSNRPGRGHMNRQ